MDTNTDESQLVFSHNKYNANTMRVGNIILASASESVIDDNWCLLNNQSTYNNFINIKYLSNIRDAPDGQYVSVHCNEVVTYTNKIGDIIGYSNYVWYNTKGVSNTL